MLNVRNLTSRCLCHRLSGPPSNLRLVDKLDLNLAIKISCVQETAMKAYNFTSDETADMMKVQVYLTSLNVEIVTESPTYEVTNMTKAEQLLKYFLLDK